MYLIFFFQAEDGIRDGHVTGVQTCALPISCVRDYVHVLDLADAHVAALEYLRGEQRPHRVFNVGTGTGSSVLEVIEAIARAKGIEITPEIGERRAGDPARLICSTDRIRETLGWESTKTLDDIVRSAVEARAGA